MSVLENPVITFVQEIDLVKAYSSDLKELAFFERLPNGILKGIYKLKKNLPFWLLNSKGELEPYIHFLNDNWNLNDIKTYLENGQIYIAAK